MTGDNERTRPTYRRGLLALAPSLTAFYAGCISGNPSGANPTATRTAEQQRTQREDSDGDGAVDANDPFPEDARWGNLAESDFVRLQTTGVAEHGEDLAYSFTVESPFGRPWACRVGVTALVRGSGGGSSLSENTIVHLSTYSTLDADYVVEGDGTVTMDELTNNETFGFLDSVTFELDVVAVRSNREIDEEDGEHVTVSARLPYD